MGAYGPTKALSACSACALGTYADKTRFTACTDCVAGTITSAMGQSICAPCPTGDFQGAAGMSSCDSCPSGKFSSQEASTYCAQCVKGKYNSLPGFSSCSSCQTGQITNTEGSNTFFSCLPGTYANVVEMTACLLCPTGKISTSVASALCEDCEAGKYNPTTNKAECTFCEMGKYGAKVGQSYCDQCAVGTFIGSAAATSCFDCDTGSYTAINGTVTCTACEVGKYQPSKKSTACLNCPVGKFINALSSTVCTDCGTGKYQSMEGQTGCVNAPAGRYADMLGMSAPIVCAVGSYQDVEAKSTCVQCGPGKYTNITTQTYCEQCATGFFNPTSGVSKCESCVPGKYTNELGAQVCLNCEVGKFGTWNEGTYCSLCDSGDFQMFSGLTKCNECGPGKYAESQGKSFCLDCPAGKYCPTARSYSLTPCPKGKYTGAAGLTACSDCAAGTIASQESKVVCDACLPGKYISENGTAACLDCGQGTYAGMSGQSFCKACDPGFYADQQGSDLCTPCPFGTYQTLGGMQACLSCPSGEYGPVVAATSCKLCPPGKYNDGLKQAACKECQAGSSASANGTVVCDPCAEGKYTADLAQFTCADCPVGKFQPNKGTTVCEDVGAGQYQNEIGQPVAKDCPAGTFNKDTGKATCELCELGNFNDKVKQLACSKCTAGTYTGTKGKDSCVVCEAGKYGELTGMTACKECDMGQYMPDTAAKSCKLCETGTFQKDKGQVSCTDCAKGFYQRETGRSSCVQAEPGKYVSKTKQSGPADCDSGTFTVLSQQEICSDCPSGKYQGESGKTMCIDCDTGWYNGDVGKADCLVCPAGKFQNITGSIVCDDCPRGSFNPITGVSVCTTCPRGKFAKDLGVQASCTDCEKGYYGSPSYTTRCERCQAGKYMPDEGRIECLPCPLGMYYDQLGAKICSACAPGKYAPWVGHVECQICPAGKFSVSQKAECTNCTKGTFSLENSASCTQCNMGTYADGPGFPACSACIAFAESTVDYTACICRAFYYMKGGVCEPCPEGGNCLVAGTTEYNIRPLVDQFATLSSASMQGLHVQRQKFSVKDISRFDPCNVKMAMAVFLDDLIAAMPQLAPFRARIQVVAPVVSPPEAINSTFACKDGAVKTTTGPTTTTPTNKTAATAASSMLTLFTYLNPMAPKVPAGVASASALHYSTSALDLTDASSSVSRPAASIVHTPIPTDAPHRYTMQGVAGTPLSKMDSVTADSIDLKTFGAKPTLLFVVDFNPPSQADLDAAKRGGYTVPTAAEMAKVANASLADPALVVKTGNLGAMRAVPEYNRFSVTTFLKCFNKACVQNAGGDSGCQEGYRGNVCAMCDVGWGRTTTFECKMCPDQGDNMLLLSAAFVGNIGLMAFLSFNTIVAGEEAQKAGEDEVTVPLSILQKITLNCVSVLGVAAGMDFKWPGFMGSMMTTSESTGNSQQLMSLDCVLQNMPIRPFYINCIFSLMQPLVAIFIEALLLGPAYLIKRSNRAQELVETSGQPLTFSTNMEELSNFDRAFKGYGITTLTVVLFGMHPSIVRNTFLMIACQKLGPDGKQAYLASDLEEECWTPNHMSMLIIVCLPMTIFWVVGIPLIIFIHMFSNRELIQLNHRVLPPEMKDLVDRKLEFEAQMAFVYQGYQAIFYYWFLMEQFRKMALVATGVFFMSKLNMQILLASVIVFICLWAQIQCDPFDFVIMDWIEFYSLFTCFNVFYLGQFFFADAGVTGDDVKEVVSVLIAMMCMLFFVAVFYGGYWMTTNKDGAMRDYVKVLKKRKIIQEALSSVTLGAPPAEELPEDFENPHGHEILAEKPKSGLEIPFLNTSVPERIMVNEAETEEIGLDQIIKGEVEDTAETRVGGLIGPYNLKKEKEKSKKEKINEAGMKEWGYQAHMDQITRALMTLQSKDIQKKREKDALERAQAKGPMNLAGYLGDDAVGNLDEAPQFDMKFKGEDEDEAYARAFRKVKQSSQLSALWAPAAKADSHGARAAAGAGQGGATMVSNIHEADLQEAYYDEHGNQITEKDELYYEGQDDEAYDDDTGAYVLGDVQDGLVYEEDDAMSMATMTSGLASSAAGQPQQQYLPQSAQALKHDKLSAVRKDRLEAMQVGEVDTIVEEKSTEDANDHFNYDDEYDLDEDLEFNPDN